MRMTAPTLLLLTALGCAAGSDGTALDLELTPDPNLNTPEQVAAALETIVLVLDSPDGLYPPGSETVVGNVQIKNADADPENEVVVLVPVPTGRLPWIRVYQGGLVDLPADTALTIRVTGLATGGSTRAIASGSVEGIGFEEGEVVSVSIPFDLGSEVRPPRVEAVLPPEDGTAPGCVVYEVNIVFSEAMDEASVTAVGAIEIAHEPEVSIDDVELSGGGYLATLTVSGLEGTGMLGYGVRVNTTVKDLDGNQLDQTSAQDGDQPYEGSFQLTCTAR